jgi:hypothetical protein
MDNTQLFFIDTLKLIPLSETSILLVQAPYDELKQIFEKISFKNENGIEFIKLNIKNIKILLFEIIYNDFEGYLQNATITVENKKIFEGYDCMEYGQFSKNFNLPIEFKRTHKGMIMISEDW